MNRMIRSLIDSTLCSSVLLCSSLLPTAHAATGLDVIAATSTAGPITVFYPSDSATAPVKRGAVTLDMAWQGTPKSGNQRLIVLSHGSGGSPWQLTDLANRLVADGYTVAVPEHEGDNYHSHSKVGPETWKLRPLEISHAIDAMAADTRFATLFDAQRVGVWGMSAGGHTALTLAGGRWSPAKLLTHCEAHLAEDFAACTGAATELTGSGWDGIKKTIAMPIIRWVLSGDETFYGHTDPRIKAIIAGVPFAVDFDLSTLAKPVVPLGLIRAGQDRWLVPQFHGDRVIATCQPTQACEVISDMPTAGHGALLAPLPQGLPERIQRLLDDPSDFERTSQLPVLYERTTAFFKQHLRP